MKEFLEKELDKLKISQGERKILIDEFVDWEWEFFEEDFIKENGRKPTEKEGKQFVKEYIEKNSIYRKPPMRQAEKENAIRKCLLDALEHERKHLSVNEMSEHLIRCGFSRGASAKTIYKHVLGELAEYGIKKGADGKYYYENAFEEQRKIYNSVEQDLSNNEKESLTIISNFLETIKESPAYDKAVTFIENEKKKFKTDSIDDNTSNFSRIVFMGAPEANLKKETWDTIYKAMKTNSPLKITYTSEGKKESTVYGIRPYQLIFDNGCWELWAQSLKQKHEGMRLFNLSRINDIEIQEATFSLPQDYNFMNQVTGSFGCYRDEIQKLYKIRFMKESYAWLYSKDRVWGDNQTGEETQDGYILSFEANQFKPILRWILGWGDEVEPIEPEELVTEWKNKILNMTKKLTS